MNKLTQEEIAKVLSMYMFSDFRYRYVDFEPGVWAIGAKLTPERLVRVLNDKSIDGVQLLLTPLSKITDEHAIDLMHIEYQGHSANSEILKINRRNNIVELSFRYIHPDHNNDDGYSYSGYAFSTTASMQSKRFQYLISKRYDVPLWFGLNHWANNKTAIQLGIAIEKP